MVTASISTSQPPIRFERNPIVVVMGVAGSGKSTIAAALAERLRLPFLEGDDFHPVSNVKKMARGAPLDDDDRWPWLRSLGKAMQACADEQGGVVAACSALRRAYRKCLGTELDKPMMYALLDVPRDTLARRLRARKDHFMPESLLESQLATLERPTPDEAALILAGVREVHEIVDELSTFLARARPVDIERDTARPR